MHTIVKEEIPDDPELRAAWNNLVLRMEQPEVFFTYEWARAASHAFQKKWRPLLFLMYESEQLVGIIALATLLDKPATAFFLTASTADYCDVVATHENCAAVLRALFKECGKRRISNVVLANLPADSATFHELARSARPGSFHVVTRDAYECGIIELGDEEQRKNLALSVTRKDREKRGLKKLLKLGALHIRHVTEAQRVSQSVDQIISAQILRFLAAGRVSPLVHPQQRVFIRELATLLARASWMKISQLEIDGNPVAWNYGFRFHKGWFWYLPTFQIEFEYLSPGSCLLRLLVEEACADFSLQRLDLGLGDESYKERFANAKRRTVFVQLSRRLPRHLSNSLRNAVATFAARHPAMKEKLTGWRDLLHRLRKRLRETGFAATGRQAIRTITRTIASSDEILLFAMPRIDLSQNTGIQLEPLAWQSLAEATIANAGDTPTLNYLMRCAQRLRGKSDGGFILRDEGGQIVHFLWIGKYDGFHLSEIDYALKGGPADFLVFDCWTPLAFRGRGFYSRAIRQAASNLQAADKECWIFCGSKNTASIRGIMKAEFARRSSLIRKKKFGRTDIRVQDTSQPAA